MKKFLVFVITLMSSAAMFINAQEVKKDQQEDQTKTECVEKKEECCQKEAQKEECKQEEKEN
ncbi:MAG: hypothetical protein LUD74_07575 [Tannerellaceae bacterium]|nr:hypothetical protein [Tannerellaceae bacterium]